MRKNRMKIRLCSMVLAAQFLFSSMAAPALAVEASGVELAAQSQQAEEQTEAMTAPEPQTEAGEEALTGMAEETKPETELQETVKDPSASDAGTQAGQSEGATGAAQTDESTAESGETAKNAETAAETVKDPEVGSENDGSGQQTPAETVENTEKSSEADAVGEQSGSEEAQEDFTVQAPMAVDTLMLQEQIITTDQDKINVVVSGCDRFRGGYLILTTGSSVTDGDGDSRDRVGSERFNGEGTYRFHFNKGTLKAGNTVQAHLYIYDGDSDRTYYQYSPSVLVQGSGSTVQEASVEIVTDEIRADRTDVRVKAQFGPDVTAALKLYTWSGETFDAELATLISAE